MAKYDISDPMKPKLFDPTIGDYVDLTPSEYMSLRDKNFEDIHVSQAFSSHSSGAQREKMGKPRYDLMPARLVNDYYAKIADFGAQKYAARNWEKGLPQSQIADSLQRHLWAYMEGEDLDQESKLEHVGHILWNAVALLYGYHHKLEDDRIPVVNKSN